MKAAAMFLTFALVLVPTVRGLAGPGQKSAHREAPTQKMFSPSIPLAKEQVTLEEALRSDKNRPLCSLIGGGEKAFINSKELGTVLAATTDEELGILKELGYLTQASYATNRFPSEVSGSSFEPESKDFVSAGGTLF